MDRNTWIEKVVRLYFEGHSVDEALKATKDERKEEELKKIAEKWNG